MDSQKDRIMTKCRKNTRIIVQSPCEDSFLTFFGHFRLFGQRFDLVTLSNASLSPVTMLVSPWLWETPVSCFQRWGLTGLRMTDLRTAESENSRRLWLFPGSARGFSGKTPGKSRENCWKIFPESRNATNSMISGTGKGKPAANLGSTLPGPCPHLPCRVLLEIDSSGLLEFY